MYSFPKSCDTVPFRKRHIYSDPTFEKYQSFVTQHLEWPYSYFPRTVSFLYLLSLHNYYWHPLSISEVSCFRILWLPYLYLSFFLSLYLKGKSLTDILKDRMEVLLYSIPLIPQHLIFFSMSVLYMVIVIVPIILSVKSRTIFYLVTYLCLKFLYTCVDYNI